MRAKHILTVLAVLLGGVAVTPPRMSLGDDAAPAKSAKDIAREKWEKVVLWYGNEETGAWSLRIRDADVKNRARFEYLELWQFNRTEEKWQQIKVEKSTKWIALPNQKDVEEPADSQVLVELKEIEPQTAGIWYAKWKIDDIECGTLMRVGSGPTLVKVKGPPPKGMILVAVPITLEKSEAKFIPDPRIYCIAGGSGKPEAKTDPPPKTDDKEPAKSK